MAFSMLSIIGNYKQIQLQPSIEYELLNLTFTDGTDYTNNGNLPFELNPSTNTSTRCKIGLVPNDLNTTIGSTIWIRYKLHPISYARAFSFSASNNNASQTFISYNGTNYNRYDFRANVSGNARFNGTTGTVVNSNNIYNVFYEFKTIASTFYFNLYVYDDLGNVILSQANHSVTLTQWTSNPYVNYDLFRDNAYGGGNYRGTCYMCSIFRKVLTSGEKVTYSTKVL
jgi:hypothetical protein